ncbi:enolase C-terminal domain-like protein [Sphingobacterium sp.]|uniref:enolase C-terminal domain-like protein n=1 Tax=Sphingobacterium sp. TaxID=341027 RepID=UPI00258F9F85|nr:enolase C-terminal domain-like protein [Sphingobacterium sp.]WET67283.1 MAG: enolase C-terminal domain-like protein [Sphingobacterium sp.]
MNSIELETFNIQKISIRVLAPVATITPFQDATMGPFPSFGLSIIRIEDAEGFVGEAPVYNSYTNILETCLFPILFHCEGMSYQDFFPKLYWSIRNEGFKGAASALLGQVDMALHDLAAKRSRLPLYRYIGGDRNTVKIYGSGGGTNYTLKELEKEVTLFLDAGVDCYKMKIGKDFGTNIAADIARVKHVRKLAGKHMQIAVDVNQIWSCEDVFRFLDAIGENELAWLEEPIHSAAYDQIEELCKRTAVPIAYGESERTSKIFPMLANCGVKHLQPVPTQFGGIKEWMEVRDLCTNRNLQLSSGGYSLYSSFLMTTASESGMIEYLYALMYGLEKYFLIKPSLEKGHFHLPESEGLPVRINWEYCLNENKIIREQVWLKADVPGYNPLVSM